MKTYLGPLDDFGMMEDSSSWRPGNFGKDLAAEAAKEKPKPTETSEVDSSLTNGHSEEAEPIEPKPIEPEPEPVDPAVPSRTLTPDPVEEDDKSESTVVGGDASKQIGKNKNFGRAPCICKLNCNEKLLKMRHVTTLRIMQVWALKV